MCMQNLVKIQQFIVKILGKNEILTSVMKLQKLMCNNPNIALVIINLYTKFGENPSIHTQDIERKWNSDNSQGQ